MVDLVGRMNGVSFEQLYSGSVVAAMAAGYARCDVEICAGFCRWHNSDDCPHRDKKKPAEGYCGYFSIKVEDQEGLTRLLLDVARAHKIDIR